MFLKQTALLGLAALSGYPQTSPAAPAPPSHVLRGRSISGRVASSKRGWLGVGVIEVTAERAKALKFTADTGVEVTHVEENSPAAKAGLKEHDVILEVNGQKVDDTGEFVSTIGETAPGSKVALTVWRSGARQNVAATLGARPLRFMTLNGPVEVWSATPTTPFMTGQAPLVGFEGETLTAQLAAYFGVNEGVLVRTVTEKTAASKAGLKAGDVIIKVSGTPVSSTREISGLIRALHKNVTFTVMRNHKEVLLNVELAEDRLPVFDRDVM